MKKSLSIILTLTLAGSLYAQDIRFSEYIKMKNNDDMFVIGGDEKGVFAGITEDPYLKGSGNKHRIIYYNSDMQQQESKILKSAKKSREYFYSFYFNGQLQTLAYDNTNTDDHLVKLYLESYNHHLEKAGEEQYLTELYPVIFTNNIGSYFRSYFSNQFGKARSNLFFSHKLSPDQKKAAILFNYNLFNSDSTDYQCLVLDHNRQVVWSDFIEIPDKSEYMMLENYILANDGNLYLLMASFQNKNFRKTATEFEYHLYRYNPDKQTTEIIPLESNGKFIINLNIQITPDHSLPILAGLYGSPQTGEIQGGLVLKPDNKGSYQLIENKFDKEIAKEINIKEDQKYAEEYTIKDVLSEEGGGTVFFAESYKRGPVLKPKLSLSGFSPVRADIELGDIYRKIIAVRLTPNGNNNWTKIINKEQRSSEEKDIYASYALAYTDNAYYLLFNNQIKSTSDVSVVTIQKDGDISLETIFTKNKSRLRLIPAFAQKIRQSSIVLPIEQRGGKQALTEVEF